MKESLKVGLFTDFMSKPNKPFIKVVPKAVAIFGGHILQDIVRTRNERKHSQWSTEAYQPFTEKEMQKIMWWIQKGASLTSVDSWGHSLVARLFEPPWGKVMIQTDEHSSSQLSTLTYFLSHIPLQHHSELTTHLFLHLKHTETSNSRALMEQLLEQGANPLAKLISRFHALNRIDEVLEEKKRKAELKWQRATLSQELHENHTQLDNTRHLITDLFVTIGRKEPLQGPFLNHLSAMDKEDLDWIQKYTGYWKPYLSDKYPTFIQQLEILFEKQHLTHSLPTVSSEENLNPPPLKKMRI